MSDKKNIKVFPLLKTMSLDVKDKTEITSDDVELITTHYMTQLIRNLVSHGFVPNDDFITDFSYVEQFFTSALLRNIDEYHYCQDYIDDVSDFISQRDNEENKETES
jgi:hypothetical protein